MDDCNVESTIKRLKAVLNKNYLRKEWIISLPNCKTDKLDKTFEKLLGAMAFSSLESETI